MAVKHPMLGSFEGLLKRIGQAAGHEWPQERTIAEEGSFLGRKWQRYSDGTIEGETVAGMQRFHNLEQFKSFIEVSPAVLDETSARQGNEPPAEPAWDAPREPTFGAEVEPTDATAAGEFSAIAELEDVRPESPAGAATTTAGLRKSVPTGRDAELARNMVIGGALGILLCVGWWLHSYVLGDLHAELVRRGMSASAIASTHRLPTRYVSCLVANTDTCTAVKNWGRFANYLIYEPGFLWISACILILGFALDRAQKRRAANDAGE